MGNIKNNYKHEDLITAYNYVSAVFGVDIASKCRAQEYVDGRTLYYMIALKTTQAGYADIAEVVNRDHSTVSHAIKNLFRWLREDQSLYRHYEMYLKEFYIEIAESEEKLNKFVVETEELKRLRAIKVKYEALREVSLDVARLTVNERAYRALSAEDRLDYDRRADLVLKGFKLKNEKWNKVDDFEIINVGM